MIVVKGYTLLFFVNAVKQIPVPKAGSTVAASAVKPPTQPAVPAKAQAPAQAPADQNQKKKEKKGKLLTC